MKKAMEGFGFMMIMAGAAMADSETLVPTVVCCVIGCIMMAISGGLFKRV